MDEDLEYYLINQKDNMVKTGYTPLNHWQFEIEMEDFNCIVMSASRPTTKRELRAVLQQAVRSLED